MNKVISLSKATVKRAERDGKHARLTGSVEEIVSSLRPSRPLYILKPEQIAENARLFLNQFPGTVMFPPLTFHVYTAAKLFGTATSAAISNEPTKRTNPLNACEHDMAFLQIVVTVISNAAK